MVRSDRFLAGFVCADSNRFFDGVDEYFAVTDLAGFRGAHNRNSYVLDHAVREHDFDLEFWYKFDRVLVTAINFCLAFLTPVSLTSVIVMPSMPSSVRASFTSSSLKGLMIASIFFISWFPPAAVEASSGCLKFKI